MGRLTNARGRIIVLGSLPSFRAHRDRHEGFREALAEFPHLVIDVIDANTRDDAERCFHATRAALAEGGAARRRNLQLRRRVRGIADALAAHRGPRPNWIGHEISADHVDYLRRGLMDVASTRIRQARPSPRCRPCSMRSGDGSATFASRAELRVYTRHVCRERRYDASFGLGASRPAGSSTAPQTGVRARPASRERERLTPADRRANTIARK